MIKQCYISKSIDDFPFRGAYGLSDYIDSSEPCIFFGCYRREDIEAIYNHKSLAVVVWCGQDAISFTSWYMLDSPNIFSVSFMPKVYEFLKTKTRVQAVKYPDFKEGIKPIIKGDSVYAYCPKSAMEYHRHDLIQQLSKRYDVIIGDGSHSQVEWRSGLCNEYYNKCFIGVALSEFAGGGSTIVELGLRGIKCITNVLNIPNAIKWKGVGDIVFAIEQEKNNIGSTDNQLAYLVQQSLDINKEILNINNYK